MKVLLKHGTPAEISGYIGLEGELIVNDGGSMLYVTDGTTVGGHPINGIVYNVSKPSIIGPVDASTGVSVTPIIQGSAFSGDGTHAASFWEIATDLAFTNIVHNSGRDTTNLVQYDISNTSFVMDALTTYYARVKHESNYGVVSGYSDVVSFTTKMNFAQGIFSEIIESSDRAASDRFGKVLACAKNANVMVVGSPYSDPTMSLAGSAYVYRLVGGSWIQETKLIATGTGVGADEVGTAVAISADGNTIVLGAIRNDTKASNSGCAHIFKYVSTSWVLDDTIYASNGSAVGIGFGASVAVSGDGSVVAVGTLGGVGAVVRSVYIFTKPSTVWVERDKIDNPGAADDYFGTYISMSGDGITLIINGHRTYNNGKAYIYEYMGSSWAITHTAVPTPDEDAGYGYRVNISSDGLTAFVTATKGADNKGRVGVFNKINSVWTVGPVLTPTDPLVNSLFGSSIDSTVDGLGIVVGRYGTYEAYVFKNENGIWTQQAKLTQTPATSSSFGWDVAISGDGGHVMVGAFSYSVTLANAGAVYVFN